MEYNLKDLVEIKYGKNQKHVKNPHGKYPILGTGGVIDLADQYLYDKPSVLIGRKGSIGKVKYIDKPFWTIDTLFYTKINETKVLPKFLYYKLSMIDFNYYNEGTTIPSLRTVKSRLLCKMLYNVFTISTYQN
ncbi:restriction endonuclease subunit S [Staphylococcus aureus]|uniref:restriction endonuclease subunit S n=1 Tax=Staphylococcus aureus TaxID=1280 RepID=UPI003D9BD39E